MAEGAPGRPLTHTTRALSVGRTHRVGLLVTDLTNQFYTHTIAPIDSNVVSPNAQ